MEIIGKIISGTKNASGQNGNWGKGAGTISLQYNALLKIATIDESLVSQLKNSYFGTVNIQLDTKINYPVWRYKYKNINWYNAIYEDLHFHPVNFIYDGIAHKALWYLASQNIHLKNNCIEIIAPFIPELQKYKNCKIIYDIEAKVNNLE